MDAHTRRAFSGTLQNFEAVFRLAQTGEHQTGGSGLGLSIAQRIANVYGGTIQARNREGGGLEIEIQLPLKNSG